MLMSFRIVQTVRYEISYKDILYSTRTIDTQITNYEKVKVLVAQSCLILCDPMDCSLPGSSVHGILQARILEWIVMYSSRGSSQPSDQTWVSYIAGRFFTI